MIRNVLIAEDHPLCASALTAAAQSIDGALAIEVVENFSEVLERLSASMFSILVLDLALKDSKGLENLSTIRSQWPDLPVLMISANEASHLPGRAAALGARGFQTKAATIPEMKSAISVVLEGGTWFPKLGNFDEADLNPIDRLTPAQNKVLRELAKGKSNKAIAFDLGLSEPTIKSHMTAILRALGVSNRAQAILALQESSDA